MIDQDVLDCLDGVLSALGRKPRIDTNGPLLLREIVLQFETRAKKEVKRQLQYVPLEKKRPVYVSFCEDETYGAFAVRDRYDYIVLHIGVVPRLIDFFDRMMENAALWTHVTASAPDDCIRLAFAVVYMHECFDIIVRHELAHLVLGHCEFQKRRYNALTAQALEFAADGHAVGWGAQRLAHFPGLLDRHRNAVGLAYRAFHRTPDEAVRNYLLATYLVFRLLDETKWSSDVLTKRPHPPAPIRFHVACLHLHEYYEQNRDLEGKERLARAMDRIWELGEFIFAETLERMPDPDAKRQVMELESERYFALVHRQAQTLPQSLFGLS